MADLTDSQSSINAKISGSDSSGVETNFAKVSVNQDLGTADVLNGGVDVSLNLSTSPILGVTNVDGVTPLENRKYLIMQATTTNVKWGFSASTQNFDLFKSQVIMIPAGILTTVYFKVSTGTGAVSIGEVS